MNTNKLIWLAGLFEGEGTTGLYKYRRENGKWRINSYFLITNCDPAIIWEIKKITNEELGVQMTIYTRDDIKRKNENWNLSYQILTRKMSDTYKLLETLLPYLIGTKKYVGQLTMDFIKSRNFGDLWEKQGRTPYSENDWKLYEKCKIINQRGKNKKLPESSETIRQTLAKIKNGSEDIVQTSMKIGEGIQKEF